VKAWGIKGDRQSLEIGREGGAGVPAIKDGPKISRNKLSSRSKGGAGHWWPDVVEINKGEVLGVPRGALPALEGRERKLSQECSRGGGEVKTVRYSADWATIRMWIKKGRQKTKGLPMQAKSMAC